MPAAEGVARERLVLGLLTAVQVCATLDFVGLMPLGPQLMRSLAITPGELGLLTTIYTVAAAVSGVLGSSIVDRFDRKHAVLVLLAGFIGALVFSASAPSYPALALARAFAGTFGGVLTGLLISIVSEIVPPARRGRAIGVVMSAFAIASIAGLPVSLTLASMFGWRMAYAALAVVATAVAVAVAVLVPPVRGHLHHAAGGIVTTLGGVLANRTHRRAWGFTALVSFSSYLIVPFISPFLVLNTGVSETVLPLYYLVGGAASLGSARFAGLMVDRRGTRWTFARLSLGCMLVVIGLVQLGRVPIAASLMISTMLFAVFPGRLVAAMATATAAADPARRGGFMSLNAAVQQLAAGGATAIAASIVARDAAGALTGFDVVGYLAVAAMGIAIVAQKHVHGR